MATLPKTTSLEVRFWSLLDTVILLLRRLRLDFLSLAAEWGLDDLPEPPTWAWIVLPTAAFLLGGLISALIRAH